MSLSNCLKVVVGVAFLWGLALDARALVLYQIDTFEDGTTQNWGAGPGGHPQPPVNAPTGGPGGAGDHYLTVTALGGNGPGSRLSVLNLAQWGGDYLAAGITAITMDVNNFGPDDLDLRLLFADPAGGPPSNIAISSDAVHVAAGAGWVSVIFPIVPSALKGLLGTVTGALSGATELRLFHNPAADFPGPGIGIPSATAVLGIDNIQAVPEPATLALTGLGLAALWRVGRRRVVA